MLGVLEELAGEAARRLEERHEGGRRWDARLFRVELLGQPHVQPDQVVSKSGIERIGQRLDPLAEQAPVAALIDRLGTRLGRERVRRIHPRDSHIPEQAELAASDSMGWGGSNR
jgi:protein ImuB